MKFLRPTKSGRGERGIVSLIAAVSMFVLLGFAGMAIDAGYLQWTKVRVQDAADAAVQSAIIELEKGNSDWAADGKAASSLNGFTDAVNGVTVTLNSPPLQGTLVGKANAVEATVVQATPTYFMQMMGTTSVNVTGYAAASFTVTGSTVEPGTGSSAGCVYVLDTAPSDSGTFFVTGSSPTFNCGVTVESPNAAAATINSAEVVKIGSGYTFGVVGPSSCTASSPAPSSGCGISSTNQAYICTSPATSCAANLWPTANGISNPGDPLSNVSVPSFGTVFSAKNYYDMNSPPAGNTLGPGIYCGGLTIGNTNGATYTLTAGTYIIAGGNLSFNSTGTVSGSGVTFYLTSPMDVFNTTGIYCPSTMVSSTTSTTIAKLVISGQPNVTLSAPGSGATSGIPGILFFENRNSTTDNTPQINGNSTTSLNGAMYFKKSTLTFTGVNGSNTGYMMIVVNKLNINGSSPIVVYNVNNPLSGTTVLTGTAGVIGQ